MNISTIVYRGPSKDGAPVCLIASIGGNKKTNQVLELTLVPSFIVEHWETLSKDAKPSHQGAVYVKALRGYIKTVCPSTCVYVRNGKGCYVQHNPRNASQVARIIRNATWCGRGLYLNELRSVAKCAKLAGIPKVRSMVAGDAAMLPADVWAQLESALLPLYPADQWLGYTHDHSAKHLQTTHVASCDTTEQAIAAKTDGWSVFEVLDPVGGVIPKGAALCPASKEFRLFREMAIGCAGCPMPCNGASAKRHRVIPRHAPGDASRKAAAARRGEVLRDAKGRVKGLYA